MMRSVRSRVIALAVGVATFTILMTAWLTTLSAEQATRDQAVARKVEAAMAAFGSPPGISSQP